MVDSRAAAVMAACFVLASPLASRAAAQATPVPQTTHTTRATIQGKIAIKPTPARRIANRYAGAASPTTEQQLPVIVYLRGAGLPRAHIPSKSPEMAQHDTTFAPAYLVVAAGTTVDFRNQDPFYHNVFSYSKAKRFDLGRFPRPEAKAVTFDKTGTIDVYCEIHRSMRGVILVTDNDYHTEAAADGSYSLADVPAGTYQLVVWHVDRGEKVISVTVPATGTVTVNASF